MNRFFLPSFVKQNYDKIIKYFSIYIFFCFHSFYMSYISRSYELTICHVYVEFIIVDHGVNKVSKVSKWNRNNFVKPPLD